MAEPLASRYARALLEVVGDRPAAVTPESALAQLESFEITLAESPELRGVLLTPAVPETRKQAVVERLASILGLSKFLRHFLCVVVRHRRSDLIPDIRRAFEDLLDEREGVVRADVVSARDLTEAQRAAVTGGLSRFTGKRVKPRFSVEPELLGGVIARIGSTVYDSSVRGRLEALERRLVSADSGAFGKADRRS
jgi:F-type H+-transporting ATPase subunit delta